MPRVCSHRAHSGFLCAASRRLLHRHLLFENVSPIADETFPSARGESITLWKQKQKQGAVCAKLRTNYTLSFTIWPVNLALAASATSGAVARPEVLNLGIVDWQGGVSLVVGGIFDGCLQLQAG